MNRSVTIDGEILTVTNISCAGDKIYIDCIDSQGNSKIKVKYFSLDNNKSIQDTITLGNIL